MEAIHSDKTWDEIKDLLRLKLHNANTHTYTSHFMDVQQWKKEFKTEARCCNFTNDTATIKNFVNGLRNAQSLAAQIYENDSHTLKDIITKMEKLIAAKQLTVTIIPSSMVNMMSNKDD